MSGKNQLHHHDDVGDLELFTTNIHSLASNNSSYNSGGIRRNKQHNNKQVRTERLGASVVAAVDFDAPLHVQHYVRPSEQLDYLKNPSTTTTSTLLIVFLHLLFFHQWNGRKRRKDVLVSYRKIIQKRRYHDLWLAMLSHPPAYNHRPRQQQPLRHSQTAATTATGEEGRRGGSSQHQQQDLRSVVLAMIRELWNWAHQSGFALMLFNSHIIWSCRSLEALYNFNQFKQTYNKSNNYSNNGPEESISTTTVNNPHDDIVVVVNNPCQYARLLFALTAVALLLELRFSHTLLRVSKRLSGSDSTSPVSTVDLNNNSITVVGGDDDDDDEGSSSNTNHSRIQQKILHRPIGTMTCLSAGLVVVFRHHFGYVSLQVFPFIDNRWLLLGFSLPPPLTSFLCWMILGYLSYPSHPLTSVICGFISGMLWSIGIISFLQEPYWGNSLFIAFILICCMSIRASGYDDHERNSSSPPLPTWIPCIDFVAWNRRGERITRSSGGAAEERERTTTTSVSSSFEDSSSDEDDDNESTASEGSFNSSDHEALYGHIPHIGDSFDESDEPNNNLEMSPLLESERNQTTVRSRRGVSFG